MEGDGGEAGAVGQGGAEEGAVGGDADAGIGQRIDAEVCGSRLNGCGGSEPEGVLRAEDGDQGGVAQKAVGLPVEGVEDRPYEGHRAAAVVEHRAEGERGGGVGCRGGREQGVESAGEACDGGCGDGRVLGPHSPVVVLVPEGLVGGADDPHEALAIAEHQLAEAGGAEGVGEAAVVDHHGGGEACEGVGHRGSEHRVAPAAAEAVAGVAHQGVGAVQKSDEGGCGVEASDGFEGGGACQGEAAQVVDLSTGGGGCGVALLAACHQQEALGGGRETSLFVGHNLLHHVTEFEAVGH